MARLFMTGWETGSVDVMTLVGTPDLVTSNQRTGAYALRIDADSEGAYINLGQTVTELYARVAFRPSQAATSSNPNGILTLVNSSNYNMLFLAFAPNTTVLALYRVADYGGVNFLATGSTLQLNTWYTIEIHATQPADSGGVFQVRLNGVLDINFTGDTMGYFPPADYRVVTIGMPSGMQGVSVGVNCAAKGLYDDFAVNNTSGSVNNSWCGPGGIEALKPTGAGTTTGLTASTGNNWDCVDEVPPSDSDYVYGATVDNYDTYALSNTTHSGSVPAVCVWTRAALSEAGSGAVAPVWRIGSTDYTGDDKNLDVSYVYSSQIYEQSPSGVSWTTSILDAAELGPKVR